MKFLRSAVLIFVSLAVFASGLQAQKLPKRECGTVVTEKQKRVELEREASGFYRTLAPQANRPYWIPLKIHIIRQTDGTGGLSLDNLRIGMQDLNRAWQSVGMQFYQYGDIDYINSDEYYTIPDSQLKRDQLRRVNTVPDTIGVYIVGELTNLCGQGTFTTDDPQGILMDKDCVGVADNPSSFPHEVGHYFDLYHTHETIFGVECPIENNCSTAGDKICDTPADPDLTDNVNESCSWTGSASAPASCDSTAYNPLTNNLMSYSRKTCRSVFTANQMSKTLNILMSVASRTTLINNISRYVALDGGQSAPCSFQTPCRTLARAAEIANPRDSIFVLSGIYPGVPPISKNLFIRKWNTDVGDVIFGQ